MRQASLARYLFRSGANMDVRQIVMGDAPAVQAIYAPYVTDTTISFEEVPPDIVEVERRIAVVLPKYPYLVAEEDGRIVGYAYASEHRTRAAYRTSVDVTVYVAPNAQDRKSVVKGTSVSVRVALGGRGIIKKKK